MRKPVFIAVVACLVAGGLAVVWAHVAPADLPEGPIRDRHELMEGIGKNAKVIGAAVKFGKLEPVAEAAEKIQASAAKIPSLFPAGSTHEKSRAKPEIWKNWPKFEENAKQLGVKAGALAKTSKGGGDVPAAAKDLFGACKSCHDDFRVPEKEES